MISYIGISGVTTPEQVQMALKSVPKDPHHKLMVGVAQTSKSLRGVPLSPPWNLRTPAKDLVKEIFQNDSRLLNIIHYASDNPDTIALDLHQITELSGPYFHGLQLNVPLDLNKTGEELTQVALYAKNHPWAYLILNLYPPTLKSVTYDPTKLVEGLKPYLPYLDAVLVDLSGGRGQTLDLNLALTLVESLFALADTNPFAIGIAGGLDPTNLNLLLPFATYFETLSIDAEGGLRTNNLLDPDKVNNYLSSAYALLG